MIQCPQRRVTLDRQREGEEQMKIRRMRWDMAVCLVLMMLTVLGLIKLDDKIGFVNKVFDIMEPYFNPVTEVPDGEIGGYATKDLPRLETEEELRNADGYFTMEMTVVDLYNMGSVTGEEYYWNIVKLDNDRLVAIKLNKDKLQEVKDGRGDKLILPTGVCVHGDSEAYALIRGKWDDLLKIGYTVVDDFYIDMDGMADSAKVLSSDTNSWVEFVTKSIHTHLAGMIPVLAIAVFLGLIFLYHWIGVKIGIFPPIFNKE